MSEGERELDVKKKLPDSLGPYLKRIEVNCYDTDAWVCLMNELLPVEIGVASKHYEEFLKLFPTNGRMWKQYLQHHIQSESPSEIINEIWGRCLLACFCIELWEYYLKYVEDIGNLSEDCFALTTSNVGHDIHATTIYIKYLTFLQSNENNPAKIRQVYIQALNTPMRNLEHIWQMYEKFENHYASHQTKMILGERTKRYAETVKKYQEKRKSRDGLLPFLLAVPLNKDNYMKYMRQKAVWKKMIMSEKRNTQRLDQKTIQSRVSFMYNQSLTCLRYLPEMWYEFAEFLISVEDFDKAEEVYEEALKVNPTCVILRLSFIDFLEKRRNKTERCEQLFQEVIKPPSNEEEQKRRKRVPSIMYIQYLEFIERTHEHGIKQVRKIFLSLIRNVKLKDEITYHVYVKLAMLESKKTADNRIKMAKSIFEFGFKRFRSNPSFVMEYVKFLSRMNDVLALRALFERVFQDGWDGSSGIDDGLDINMKAKEKKRAFFEVFSRYLRFEYEHGDEKTIEEVEKKFFQCYPWMKYKTPLRSVVHRFKFLDLLPVESTEELQFMEGIRLGSEEDKFLDAGMEDHEFFEGSGGGEKKRTQRERDREKKNQKGKGDRKMYYPDTSQMIEVNARQLQKMIRDPSIVNFDLLSDPDMDAVAKLLPLLPSLTTEHLPHIDVVMTTLSEGPFPTFQQVEKVIAGIASKSLPWPGAKKRKRDYLDDDKIKLEKGGGGGNSDLYSAKRRRMNSNPPKSGD